MDRKPGRPRSLTLEGIADAALAEGLATFSMPGVARRLGVGHSGLYRYVADRDALVTLALGQAVTRVTWPDPALPWQELLRKVAESIWEMCDTYPGLDGAALAAASPPTVVELTRRYVESLTAAGFTAEDAAISLDLVVTLVLTSSITVTRLRELEQLDWVGKDAMLSPYAHEGIWTGRGWFESKFEIMLAGLATRVDG